MFLYKFLILLISFEYIYSEDEETHAYKYDTDIFTKKVGKEEHHLIMFYAPWCGHCQRFSPTFEFIAETLNSDKSTKVNVAKVDCTSEKDLCSQHDVTGYPTLKLFKEGSTDGIKFKGTRDFKTILAFLGENIEFGNLPLNGEEKNESSLETVNGLTELTEDTFDKHIATGKHFVKFYAPWCGHCQKLAPTWEQLAQSLEHDRAVGVSKIDCTQHRPVCNQFDIKGYPTLLWIEDGKKIEKYQGQRSHDDLKAYVNRMMGNIVNTEDHKPSEESPSSVLILSGDDFDSGIQKGVSFVKFFAPWCGHCKRLAPTWEDLGKKFRAHQNVHIIKIDCTMDANKQLCSEQEVDGFPTLFVYKNGEKAGEYRGSRTLDDLYDFVIQHVGHDEL